MIWFSLQICQNNYFPNYYKSNESNWLNNFSVRGVVKRLWYRKSTTAISIYLLFGIIPLSSAFMVKLTITVGSSLIEESSWYFKTT